MEGSKDSKHPARAKLSDWLERSAARVSKLKSTNYYRANEELMHKHRKMAFESEIINRTPHINTLCHIWKRHSVSSIKLRALTESEMLCILAKSQLFRTCSMLNIQWSRIRNNSFLLLYHVWLGLSVCNGQVVIYPALVGEVLAQIPHNIESVHRGSCQDTGGSLKAEILRRSIKNTCYSCYFCSWNIQDLIWKSHDLYMACQFLRFYI